MARDPLQSALLSRADAYIALEPAPARRLDWPELEAVLPDGGLPRGVVELSAPHALGGATSIALAAIRAVHTASPRAWCAWLDPEQTLHAPGLAMAGVALERLLVVAPPREELGRIAVKVAVSRAFDVVVIDMSPTPGSAPSGMRPQADRPRDQPRTKARKRRAVPPEVLVRKLALAAEGAGATILLLTDSFAPRAAIWPVAMRIELARTGPDELQVHVAKDRRGRIGSQRTIAFSTRPTSTPSKGA